MELTRTQLAELLDCSTRTLANWEGDGLAEARIEENGSGRGRAVIYDGAKAIRWFVEREVARLLESGELAAAEDAQSGERLVKGEWDARLARARALVSEMELRQATGELVEASVVRDVLARAAAAARTLPRREAAPVGRILGCEPRDAVPLLERVSDTILGLLHEATEKVGDGE